MTHTGPGLESVNRTIAFLSGWWCTVSDCAWAISLYRHFYCNSVHNDRRSFGVPRQPREAGEGSISRNSHNWGTVSKWNNTVCHIWQASHSACQRWEAMGVWSDQGSNASLESLWDASMERMSTVAHRVVQKPNPNCTLAHCATSPSERKMGPGLQ